ncbi:MAG TPA: triose-phosphate isomerase family protein [Candidatus Paceibacterota bacterium]
MAAKYIVVANWKMNPMTLRDAKKLFQMTKKMADAASNMSIIVAPPAIYLQPLTALYKGQKVQFAGQSAHEAASGPFTGEISIAQVKNAKARFLLVGHAERREHGETNEDTARKVSAALKEGIIPILCVGEARREQSGSHFTFVREQLRAALQSVEQNAVTKIIVAYEPVWAIGSEEAMSPRAMHEMAIFIRKTIVEMHGAKGYGVKILYGGAVSEKNAGAMLKEGDVVGLLVGRASINPKELAALLTAIQEQ